MGLAMEYESITLAELLFMDKPREIIQGEMLPSLLWKEDEATFVEKAREQLEQRVNHAGGVVFPYPFRVAVQGTPEQQPGDIRTVLLPSLTLVEERAQLRSWGYVGAPALMAELWNPQTSWTVTVQKAQLYANAGVLEYWILVPQNQTIRCMRLGANGYEEAETVVLRET